MKMKAITTVCATGASVPANNINGRISRHRDGENAEIQMYLSKLKDLVPFMPKNRKLSKLEIIQHVIDYICDLQSELEVHPTEINSVTSSNLNGTNISNKQNSRRNNNRKDNNQPNNQNSLVRQPLTIRSSPNTILSIDQNNPLSSITNTTESVHNISNSSQRTHLMESSNFNVHH